MIRSKYFALLDRWASIAASTGSTVTDCHSDLAREDVNHAPFNLPIHLPIALLSMY